MRAKKAREAERGGREGGRVLIVGEEAGTVAGTGRLGTGKGRQWARAKGIMADASSLFRPNFPRSFHMKFPNSAH